MAKLYFHYSTMNAGKSTLLLQAAHNYQERGMESYLLTAQFDNRAGDARIGSRIGIGREADTFSLSDDLFYKFKNVLMMAHAHVSLLMKHSFYLMNKSGNWPELLMI